MPILIVTLPAQTPDNSVIWEYLQLDAASTLGADHVARNTPSYTQLSLLPKTGPGTAIDEVIAVVPVSQLSWQRVQLPKGSLEKRWAPGNAHPRLRAVLEGVLEDKLLDDAANLHFALQTDARDEAANWIAVCDASWLRQALQALEQVGCAVSRIVPEFTPEGLAGSLYCVGSPEQPMMLTSQEDAVLVWPASAAAFSLLQWPLDAPIVAEPALAQQAEHWSGRRVTLAQRADMLRAARDGVWDLAQFGFADVNRSRSHKRFSAWVQDFCTQRQWTPVRWTLLALLVVQIVGLNVTAYRGQTALQAKRAAIAGVLTQSFPQIRAVVDAPLQMERELARLQAESTDLANRDLESMLMSYGLVSKADTPPDAIDYVAGELRLGKAPVSSVQLGALAAQWQARGTSASLDGTTLVLRDGVVP